MKSKMSFYNQGMMKQNLKQHGWIGLIYLVGLLFSLPLQLLMLVSTNHTRYEQAENLFFINNDLQTFFVYVIPVLAGISLFRYLQVKDSSDMMHSLPVKREHLFLNHLVSGLIMLITPVIITTLITWAVVESIEYSSMITTADYWVWTGLMILFTLVLFSFSLLIGMITGMSSAQAILVYIFLLLPSALIVLISFQLEFFWYGFPESYITGQHGEKWSPLIRIIENYTTPFTATEVIVYILFILANFSLALVVYKIRHLETATQVIAFSPLKPVFKYGVTFCAMLVGGSYFSAMQNEKILGWLIFGYVFGALLGYVVSEIALQKTWQIFNTKTALGFVGYVIVASALLFIVSADLFSYETKVPTLNEVSGVYVDNSLHPRYIDDDEGKVKFHSEQKFIEDVIALHKKVAKDQLIVEESNYKYEVISLAVAYKLKNGNVIARDYVVPIYAFENELSPVFESQRYKENVFQLHELDQPTDKITIDSYRKRFVIADPVEIQQFKDRLRTQISSLTFEDIVDNRAGWGHISLDQANDHNYPHFNWKKSYTLIDEWLEEKGYLSDARLIPSDVEKVKIAKMPDRLEYPYHVKEFIEKNEVKLDFIEITDKAAIEEALLAHVDYGDSPSYIVQLITNDGHQINGVFTERYLPAFVKDINWK